MTRTHHRATPLRDALLAGLPLALLLGAVLLIAGVPWALAVQGAAVAFGVGSALELLNARAGWAKSLGGVVTVALGLYVAVSWADWGELLGGDIETARAKQALRIVPPTGAAPAEAPAGYRDGAGSPGGTGVRAPARAEIGGGGTAGTREPVSEARADPAAAVLVIRNETGEDVDVWLQRPGSHSPVHRLGPDEELELTVPAGDVARTRIAWSLDGDHRSVAWSAAAAGGAMVRIQGR